MNAQKLSIGLDIGGTFIKSALVNKTGQILKSESIPTQDRAKDVIHNIFSAISHLLKQNLKIAGIGIGVPGNVNRKNGTLEGGAYNLPSIENLSLTKEIRKKYDLPAFIDNDATNATKGEFLFGAGKGYDHLVLLTLGTGIGGGIILNRSVFHGITDYAGEIGHMTLFPDGMLCSCGNRGCFEAYASATAMINLAQQALKRDLPTQLKDIEEINGKVIFRLAYAGDTVCQDIIKTVARYLALGIANVINLLNIPLVVIGGGISAGGEILFDEINIKANNYVLPKLRDTFKVVKAELGNNAGVIGSAATVFMKGETEY